MRVALKKRWAFLRNWRAAFFAIGYIFDRWQETPRPREPWKSYFRRHWKAIEDREVAS